MLRTSSKTTQYLTNGVTISPSTPVTGEKVKIVYDGILAKSGATDVIAHVGFGNSWTNAHDVRMVRTTTGFEATLPVNTTDALNVCFKDCANNWDNNSGHNYTFDVAL